MDSGGREQLQRDLTALARGDRAAFDPVFGRVWPLVRGYAARCLPWEEAEDAAQEALLRVFSRASEFDARRDALSWVLGVAAWQIRTHRTRARRRREEDLSAAGEREDAEPSPEAAAMGPAVMVKMLSSLAAAQAGELRVTCSMLTALEMSGRQPASTARGSC